MNVDPNALNELATAVNSDAGKALTLPAAQEVGNFFGDVANIARFYATDNLGRIFTRWHEQRKAAGKQEPTPDDVKKVLPMLQAASMQGNEDLQARWASLLESAVSDDPDYLPSFSTSLSVLTAEQAKYLDRLWHHVTHVDSHVTRIHPDGMIPLEEQSLVKVFDPSINTGINAAEVKVYGHRMSEEQHANYKRLLHCRMVIDDLVGLKILGVTQEVGLVGQSRGFDHTDVGTRNRYAFTHYGVAFLKAVRVPDAQNSPA